MKLTDVESPETEPPVTLTPEGEGHGTEEAEAWESYLYEGTKCKRARAMDTDSGNSTQKAAVACTLQAKTRQDRSRRDKSRHVKTRQGKAREPRLTQQSSQAKRQAKPRAESTQGRTFCSAPEL